MKAPKAKKEKHAPLDPMLDTKDFAGVIELVDGKKKLRLLSPRWYAHQISKFKEGTKVSLYLSSFKPKRSQAQNRYLFGVYYPEIMKAGSGQGSLEATHEDFARRHLTIAEWRNKRGQICYIRKSTAELSKSAFSEYIENIEQDTGVLAPPVKNYGL